MRVRYSASRPAVLLFGILTALSTPLFAADSAAPSPQVYPQIVRLSYLEGDVRIARGKPGKTQSFSVTREVAGQNGRTTTVSTPIGGGHAYGPTGSGGWNNARAGGSSGSGAANRGGSGGFSGGSNTASASRGFSGGGSSGGASASRGGGGFSGGGGASHSGGGGSGASSSGGHK